jgi:hypothetical protein
MMWRSCSPKGLGGVLPSVTNRDSNGEAVVAVLSSGRREIANPRRLVTGIE